MRFIMVVAHFPLFFWFLATISLCYHKQSYADIDLAAGAFIQTASLQSEDGTDHRQFNRLSMGALATTRRYRNRYELDLALSLTQESDDIPEQSLEARGLMTRRGRGYELAIALRSLSQEVQSDFFGTGLEEQFQRQRLLRERAPQTTEAATLKTQSHSAEVRLTRRVTTALTLSPEASFTYSNISATNLDPTLASEDDGSESYFTTLALEEEWLATGRLILRGVSLVSESRITGLEGGDDVITKAYSQALTLGYRLTPVLEIGPSASFYQGKLEFREIQTTIERISSGLLARYALTPDLETRFGVGKNWTSVKTEAGTQRSDDYSVEASFVYEWEVYSLRGEATETEQTAGSIYVTDEEARLIVDRAYQLDLTKRLTRRFSARFGIRQTVSEEYHGDDPITTHTEAYFVELIPRFRDAERLGPSYSVLRYSEESLKSEEYDLSRRSFEAGVTLRF